MEVGIRELRNNLSQYLDLTAVETESVGTAVAVRQNLPGLGAPWLLLGSLGEGVGWGTDALQLGRPRRPRDPLPGLLAPRLPSTRMQHEHTLAMLQDRTAALRPGESLASGFFGLQKANHPGATSLADGVEAAAALHQPEARPPGLAGQEAGLSVEGSLFSSSRLLHCRDLAEDELGALAGPGRHHPEGEGRDPLSFFTDAGVHENIATLERYR